MSDTPKKARENFVSGSSCAQSVFGAFAEEFGIDPELAYKIASSFGGGIAHTGELCGAITGSLMALGMKYGQSRAMTQEEKNTIDAKAVEFMNRFKEKFGASKCKHLLGYNVGVPEDRAYCAEHGIQRKKCPDFIENASEILEDIMNNEDEKVKVYNKK